MQEIDGKELIITVNGEEVEYLFNSDSEETFDPTDAIEYFVDGEIFDINGEDEVCVKFNPMQYEEENQ